MVNGEAPPEADEEESEDEDEDEDMPEAGPSRPKAAAAEAADDDDEEEGDEAEADAEEGDEAEEEAEAPPAPAAPPRILITTSPSPCKLTYNYCDDLKNVFPGGSFFKRPKGRGFELGRVARWAGKRGYEALIVVNEDHKAPSERLVLGEEKRWVLIISGIRCYHAGQPAQRTDGVLQAI